MFRHLFAIFTVVGLLGCSSTPPVAELSKQEITTQHPQLSSSDAYQDYFYQWQGVPYKYGVLLRMVLIVPHLLKTHLMFYIVYRCQEQQNIKQLLALKSH